MPAMLVKTIKAKYCVKRSTSVTMNKILYITLFGFLFASALTLPLHSIAEENESASGELFFFSNRLINDRNEK